jgi:hypothetical protein
MNAIAAPRQLVRGTPKGVLLVLVCLAQLVGSGPGH